MIAAITLELTEFGLWWNVLTVCAAAIVCCQIIKGEKEQGEQEESDD